MGTAGFIGEMNKREREMPGSFAKEANSLSVDLMRIRHTKLQMITYLE